MNVIGTYIDLQGMAYAPAGLCVARACDTTGNYGKAIVFVLQARAGFRAAAGSQSGSVQR